MPATENAKPASRSAMTEADKFASFVKRIIRAHGRRVADRDIEGLAGLADLRAEIDAEIKKSAQALQAQGYSWAEIGRSLGVTRQAAQQRYGR